MEPSPETFEAAGRLCMAWSYLESQSESTLWGIVGADQQLGPLITWRLDLRNRWQMILEHASRKHDQIAVQQLRTINKDLVSVTRDRNIIVHGVAHATIVNKQNLTYGEIIGSAGDDLPFVKIPCWTVFRGAEAGKSFPISTKAVEIVRTNIVKMGERVVGFNKLHNYTESSVTGKIEDDWPMPLS